MNYFRTRLLAAALLGAATTAATPGFAQGIAHSVFMRGQVVAASGKDATVCLGRADGAQTGQTLQVYRIEAAPGPMKGQQPAFSRKLVGTVTITEITNEHFARVAVTTGAVSKHDIVELHRN